MHACPKKDACVGLRHAYAPLILNLPWNSVARFYLDTLTIVNTLMVPPYNAVFSLKKINFWHHLLIFFAEFSAAWQHGRCDRSAAHSVRWQVLELIFGGLLTTHACVCETSGSVHERVSETRGIIHARRVWNQWKCICARVWDPRKQHVSVYKINANNLQLIVAVIQRFVRHAYAARFRIIQTRKTLCALPTYTQQYLLTVFFVHGNSDTRACLRRWWNPFYFDEIRL